MYQQRRSKCSNVAFNQQRNMQHFQLNHFRERGSRYGHQPYCEAPSSMLSCNKEHWCETCDRGFRTLDILESHKQQHQVCKIDGCQFIAHPNVITKHIQMQHKSGLFKKIANLTHPDEIQKWREERKKKYPTKGNVEKKAAELKEKIERGEKMGLKRDKRKNDDARKRKYSNSYENAIDKKRCPAANTKSKKNKQIKKVETLPLPDNMRMLKPFAGILDLAIVNDVVIQQDQHCNYEIEDDDDCVPGTKMENTNYKNEDSTKKVCGALSSLMCEYGSSDEEVDTVVNKGQSVSKKLYNNYIEDNEKYNQTGNNQMCQNLQRKEHENINVKFSKLENNVSISKEEKCGRDDDDCPQEVKVERAVSNITGDKEELNRKSEKTKKHKNIHVKRPIKKPNLKLPSTLLQKLLHKEIQQERNIVLQCIRHIVKKNYFDK